MGQAKRKKQAELARTTALERGWKKWDKSVLREVLRSQAPPGVEAVATRYDPGAQEILIACDDGIVRRVSWQMMADAEREQAKPLVVPYSPLDPRDIDMKKAHEFLANVEREQQAKAKALERQAQEMMRQAQDLLAQERKQREHDHDQQREQEQRQKRDAERGPDWELAAARCAELEISLRPKELLCCCQRGGYGHHSTHPKGDPCPEKGVYAVQCAKHMRRDNREPVLCEVCCTLVQISCDDDYKLDCEP